MKSSSIDQTELRQGLPVLALCPTGRSFISLITPAVRHRSFIRPVGEISKLDCGIGRDSFKILSIRQIVTFGNI